MYELTSLRPAFNAFDMRGLVAKIRKAAAPPLPPAYSRAWGRVIDAMLRKAPEKRASVAELMAMPELAGAMHRARGRAAALMPDVRMPPPPPGVRSFAPDDEDGEDGALLRARARKTWRRAAPLAAAAPCRCCSFGRRRSRAPHPPHPPCRRQQTTSPTRSSGRAR